jgi:hypothetical protein
MRLSQTRYGRENNAPLVLLDSTDECTLFCAEKCRCYEGREEIEAEHLLSWRSQAGTLLL